MYKTERQQEILKLLNDQQKVTVQELADQFGLSKVTIRKDLDELAEQQLLTRTFGGAIPYSSVIQETNLSEREMLHAAEKVKIATKAAEFIQDGMTLFLDAGTTVNAILAYLNNKKDLTVITYDIKTACQLARFNNIKTVVLGGMLDLKTVSTYGIETFKTLQKMQIDLCFIGCEAFDLTYIYSASEIRASLKQIVLTNSKQSFLLADSSKYPKKSLYVIEEMTIVSGLITDQNNSLLTQELAGSDVVSYAI